MAYQLHALHPLLSLALLHAAIAGVWLFFPVWSRVSSTIVPPISMCADGCGVIPW
ncbi:MAG: hypothetical protein RBT64_01520 [Trichloromonas sp.]|nr:hypothetical protein [Trichloromonas sp.]